MTPPSDHQPPSDTTSTPAPSWITRWGPQLPWRLCGLSLILILGMGFVIFQYRSSQQRMRTITADVLAQHLTSMTQALATTQLVSDRNEPVSVVNTYLDWFVDEAADATDTAVLYREILSVNYPGTSFRLVLTLNTYASAASKLSSKIRQQETLMPSDRVLVTAFRTDIALMRTLFSEDLLTTGSAEDLTNAMTTFCSQNQLRTTKEQESIPDMMSASAWEEVCPSR